MKIELKTIKSAIKDTEDIKREFWLKREVEKVTIAISAIAVIIADINKFLL